MVDYAALTDTSAKVLGVPVTAAGLFVIDIGRIKPTAGGVAGAVAADAGLSAFGFDDPITQGLAAGAGFGAGQHAVYQASADAAGLTPVMVLAITADEYALLDWNGNLRSGSGPTKVFARFSRTLATATSSKSGVTHRVVLTQDDVEAKIQCNLGLLAPGKKELRAVLAELSAN